MGNMNEDGWHGNRQTISDARRSILTFPDLEAYIAPIYKVVSRLYTTNTNQPIQRTSHTADIPMVFTGGGG